MRNNIQLGLAGLLLLLSCSSGIDPAEQVYIIDHSNGSVNIDDPIIKLYPVFYYGDHNFILADTDKVYYHPNNRFSWCGTGINARKPPMIGLLPVDLQEIKSEDLAAFLNTHLQGKFINGRKTLVAISSASDTIQNPGLPILLRYLKHQQIKSFSVRNWTEEEKFVLMAKLENRAYDPANVSWRIGFDTEFVPPEIKK